MSKKVLKIDLIHADVLAYQQGDKDAVNRLYKYIDNMAWKTAHNHTRSNKSNLEEYHQIAWIGAMKALDRFDINNEKGAIFTTFCYLCMNQAVVQYWRKNKKHECEFDENGEPIRLMQSLDAELGDDGFTLADTLPGEYGCLEDLACEKWEKEFLLQELEKASVVDKEIVILSMQGVPQEIIGKRVGLPQSHVSRHYQRFIKKCRSRLQFEEAYANAKANTLL